MQVEHLLSYTLYHDLWNQNLINKEGFITADRDGLKKYKTLLEERPIRRAAETHKNRKRILDETLKLLKFESLTASQKEDLNARLQSLQLDFGKDSYIVLKPDVPKTKKYPGVREPDLSLWELKIDEAVRAKKAQRQDLRTLDKWLNVIADSKAKVIKPTSSETVNWKELENKCRKRTKNRLNEMEMKRRNQINSFHADNDYAWMKICHKKVSKKKSLKTMYPQQQAAPHILAPPKSDIERDLGVPKSERDDTPKDSSFKQKVSDTADSKFDAAPSLAMVFEKEKVFAFGDHVDSSLVKKETRKGEKIKKRLKLFRRMVTRKTTDPEEIKQKEQQKMYKTYSPVDKSKLESRESETSSTKEVRKIGERRKRGAISGREDRKISENEKEALHEVDTFRKSEEFQTLVKSENGEGIQDVVEYKMTDEIMLNGGSRENLVISETISDVLNLVELKDGELKEPKIEELRSLRQPIPVVPSMLTLEVSELLKDMLCSVEINIEEEKSKQLSVSDATKVSSSIASEEGRDDINESTCEIIEDSLEVIETFDDLLDSIASKEYAGCHSKYFDKLADVSGRDEINNSTRETVEANLDVIEIFNDLMNSIVLKEPTKAHLEDADRLTHSEGDEVNESVGETIEDNLDVIKTFDDLLNSVTSEEPTKFNLDNVDLMTDAEGREEVNESVRKTIEENLDVIKTFDGLVHSITSAELTKSQLEYADHLTDAEEMDEMNESVRKTIENNVDVIETVDDVLNSIVSVKSTESYIDGSDKWDSTSRAISVHKDNIESLVKDLITDITDKLIKSKSGEDLLDFDEEHRTEKRTEQVTYLKAPEYLSDAEFITACRMTSESKSFDNVSSEDLLPEFCTLDEILTKCVSPIKYTNVQEEPLKGIESLKRTDIRKSRLEIYEKGHSSEVLAVDISKNLETLPCIDGKTNICTLDEIFDHCTSPSKLKNITEMPFRDLYALREEIPFDLLRIETERHTAETPVEDILEATSQSIMTESDTSSDIVTVISSSLDVKQGGVECEFEEIYLGVNKFSNLQSQKDTKRKSEKQNLLVFDPKRHEVPISLSEISRVQIDDRKCDRYHSRTDLDDDSRKDSKIQSVDDFHLSERDAKWEPSRSHLPRGSRDNLRIKEKRLSSSRDGEHSRKISLKGSGTNEIISNFHENFHTIGEKLKNAERKLSILAYKTSGVLNGKEQKSRRSIVLPSKSKTQVSDHGIKTRSSISEKDQDQKPTTSISRKLKPEQELYSKKDSAKGLDKVQAHPSTSRMFLPKHPSKQKDDSELKTDVTTREEKALKHPWPAFISVDTENLAGVSAAILEKTRAFKANKGLILNKSLFSSLDECKYIKKDK